MNCYQLSRYTVIDLSQSLATSVIDLMSPMHLMISAIIKIIGPISESKNDEFRTKYPDWRYVIGEVRQYVGQDNVYFLILYSIDSPLSQTFSIKLSMNTNQSNIKKIIPHMQVGKLMDVVFEYIFPPSNSPKEGIIFS